MPVRFETPTKTEGIIVKELMVSSYGESRRDNVAVKIRILPRKKSVLTSTPFDSAALKSSNTELFRHHHHHHRQVDGQQESRERPTTAKRTRFSCWSATESQHLQHYDVAGDDVTDRKTAATGRRLPYSSCDGCELHGDACKLRCWNGRSDEEELERDDDSRRRRRSYKTERNLLPIESADDPDEVFRDPDEINYIWTHHQRRALRSMNAAGPSEQRRQRVSQPLPNQRRATGPRTAAVAGAAAMRGPTDRKPALLRRALTDLEAAEIASGYPEVYYVGDTDKANAAESARARVAGKKMQDSGGEPDEVTKGYDDDEGYYLHVPHDQIAYRYEVLKVLGRGSFGQVVRAFDHKTRRWVALKIVRSEERFRRQAVDEVHMLSLLSRADADGRAHVVRMLDHFEFRHHPCIVFEPLGVDLYEALRRRGYRGFPLAAARRAAHDITSCLALLRRHGIIHCDLKPENVLLTLPPSAQRRTSSGTNINVKVIDFGSSCYETDKLFVYVQSRFYRAPEVILSAGYGTPVDMWSLGCIVAELITGRPLFAGDDEADQLSSQLEYLGMPPSRLLARSKRAAQFFSTTTNLPRYCSFASQDEGADEGLPPLTGSVNRSGTYRCPPGAKNLDSALLKIVGRDAGVMDRRHRDYINFVRRCIEWEPSARLTPDEALGHPWLLQAEAPGRPRVGDVRHRPGMVASSSARRRPASHGDENEFS